MTGRQQQEQRRYRGVLGAALMSESSIGLRQRSEQQKSSNKMSSTGTGSPP